MEVKNQPCIFQTDSESQIYWTSISTRSLDVKQKKMWVGIRQSPEHIPHIGYSYVKQKISKMKQQWITKMYQLYYISLPSQGLSNSSVDESQWSPNQANKKERDGIADFVKKSSNKWHANVRQFEE